MVSLTMGDGVLRVTAPHVGEDAVWEGHVDCETCPLSSEGHGCIYDKVSPSPRPTA